MSGAGDANRKQADEVGEVVVAETRLSEVDGERGTLVLCGADIGDLSGRVPYESVCARLWGQESEQVARALGAGRVRAFERIAGLGDALFAADGMEALRAALAHLRADPEEPEVAPADIAGAAAVFASAWLRTSRGLALLRPDPAMGQAADTLRMVDGAVPDAARAAALDAYFVAVIDHGMNPSTFTARVVASTGADTVSAVVAAVCALKGPLHGGAPGPVLDMLEAIGSPERAREWLEGELAAGRRIMGMGHPIYRVRDPRAAVLEREIARLEQSGARIPRLPLARAVERDAASLLRAKAPSRPLFANVEFYTAVLLDAIGLPRSAFTPMFAVARTAGWCAHIAEQRAARRFIHPVSRYIGPASAR